MNVTRSDTLRTAPLVIATMALAMGGAAQAADATYPTKPIRIVVPFAAGGSTDILIRTVSQKLSELLGQQLIIDNRGGAGGRLGAELAAKAPPDGYTVMATTSGVLVVNPSLYQKLSYDPFKDFVPVSIIASLPNVLVVHPSLPVRSVKELVALARARPGELTYASGGNGTSNHLAGELLKYRTGVDVTHVPYKGGGPAVIATLTGDVTMLFATMPSAMGHVKNKRLRGLAVTSRTRSPATPELPTMIEAGVKGFEVSIWIGMMAPRGTSDTVTARLNSQIRSALQTQDVVARLRSAGYDPVGSSPEEMTASMRTEFETWARVIKAAGISAD